MLDRILIATLALALGWGIGLRGQQAAIQRVIANCEVIIANMEEHYETLGKK